MSRPPAKNSGHVPQGHLAAPKPAYPIGPSRAAAYGLSQAAVVVEAPLAPADPKPKPKKPTAPEDRIPRFLADVIRPEVLRDDG